MRVWTRWSTWIAAMASLLGVAGTSSAGTVHADRSRVSTHGQTANENVSLPSGSDNLPSSIVDPDALMRPLSITAPPTRAVCWRDKPLSSLSDYLSVTTGRLPLPPGIDVVTVPFSEQARTNIESPNELLASDTVLAAPHPVHSIPNPLALELFPAAAAVAAYAMLRMRARQ